MTPARRGSAPDDSARWIHAGDGVVTVEVMARPGAPRTAIVRVEPRGLVISINAAPEKRKANEELRRFVAKIAGVPRPSVEIVRGEASRRKVLRVATVEPYAVVEKLLAAAAAR